MIYGVQSMDKIILEARFELQKKYKIDHELIAKIITDYDRYVSSRMKVGIMVSRN